jgi:hypothetical protein
VVTYHDMVATDAEYRGPLWLRDAALRGWRLIGEFKAIEPRVVDEDGQGHIVLWWGRAFAEGRWGDSTIVNTVVDLEFDELPWARGLVIRFDGPDAGYMRGFTEAWMYGLDGTPWPIEAPGGGGVREPRRPLPNAPSSGSLIDPDDL